MRIQNWPLLTETFEFIIDHRHLHDQSAWRCGTQRCVAGWIAELSGGQWYSDNGAWIWPKGVEHDEAEENLIEAEQCAIEALGISYDYSGNDGESDSDYVSNALFLGTLTWGDVLYGLERLAVQDGITLSDKITTEIARIATLEASPLEASH